MIKQCPSCRKLFECKPDNILECQCTQIHLTSEELAYIDQLYHGCVCLQCLKDLKASFRKQGLDEMDITGEML